MVATTRGKLLVATPVLHDPNFDRTVIAMLEHNADGALGVVLTRPTDTLVRDAVPELLTLVDDNSLVFVGGPVSPEAAIAVAECAPGTEGFAEVAHGIGTLDLPDTVDHPPQPPAGLSRCRLFSGYSGWGPGQLESELAIGGWFVVEMLPADPFASDPIDLWKTVLSRQGNELAWFSNFPDDVDAN